MKLTAENHTNIAQAWLDMSLEPMAPGETVDREQLRAQMTDSVVGDQFGKCDGEDIEAIAQLIERL